MIQRLMMALTLLFLKEATTEDSQVLPLFTVVIHTPQTQKMLLTQVAGSCFRYCHYAPNFNYLLLGLQRRRGLTLGAMVSRHVFRAPVKKNDPTPSVIPDIVIITGMSGSTQALHVFEDMGYFCIDNYHHQLLFCSFSNCGH